MDSFRSCDTCMAVRDDQILSQMLGFLLDLIVTDLAWGLGMTSTA